MKHILIPTDFSSNANHALSYALQLFKCERTNFYFFHAYADNLYMQSQKMDHTSFDTNKETIAQNSEESLQKLVEEIRAQTRNPKHHYEGVSVFESLVDGINNFVNTKNIDLVIMGTKGSTANSALTFGSNTVHVFKYVKCPVLAIPDNYRFHQPKKILFPTAFMLLYKRRELKLLDILAAQFKSQVHTLYISDFEELSHRQLDNKKFLEESLPNALLSSVRTELENKAVAITEYIFSNAIDLLVMVNSRQSFLEDILHKSTIDEIALKPLVPFLVMQNLTR